jgi:hypothetical protein
MSVDPSNPGKLGKIRRVTRKIASSAAVSEKNLTRATRLCPNRSPSRRQLAFRLRFRMPQ